MRRIGAGAIIVWITRIFGIKPARGGSPPRERSRGQITQGELGVIIFDLDLGDSEERFIKVRKIGVERMM